MKLYEKKKAIELRKKGYSYNEIRRHVLVSKSTLSLWLEGVVLSSTAKKRLENQYTTGQLKSQESIRRKTRIKEEYAIQKANDALSGVTFSKEFKKILCGVLYWCEGSKSSRGAVSFTNSDPEMIKIFLRFFRSSFQVDEKKFRICVHLHSYHKKDIVLQYWSKVTNIPLSQFIKPHLKLTSGMYKKEGYQGCIRVSYNDVVVLRELLAIRMCLINMGD